MFKKIRFAWLALLVVAGCAGMDRGCSSCVAENMGGDWIIIQYRFDGSPMACWKLRGTSVTNEEHSDGIYWKGPTGHLVHISGWYNRVQVTNGDFDGAAKSVGVVLSDHGTTRSREEAEALDG